MKIPTLTLLSLSAMFALGCGAPEPAPAPAPEPAAEPAATACEPVGEIQFICDLISPEDLAIIPASEWLIASGNQEGGKIHLVNETAASQRRASALRA